MFFIKELTHTILLHPSYFGPRMLNFLESKLYSDVEGTCSGQFGYIIAVVSVLDIGKGMVLSRSGQAEFITRYRAIMFKPFKGEVVDGVVNNVTKMGFFADVGPLNVFVSHQIIEENTKLRLKIVGTRVDSTEIFAIGRVVDFLRDCLRACSSPTPPQRRPADCFKDSLDMLGIVKLDSQDALEPSTR
ncbi:DNA-directed RNA polymerase II subunit [Marasmius crinis-equi]|uniref:DNA-directed RNA polymerase II subunit n=1 Tax=Marasmius crinis-equi TaxID=585013 RepID=A0ABR3F0Z7_9AGAR